jgi:hypothetical protein
MSSNRYTSLLKRFTLSISFVHMALLCGSQTILPSAFNSDTLLSKDGSPYLIQENLTTAAGTVLQIEAGVEIRFAPGSSLTVNGELKARGTRTDSIYFVSNNGSPWLRINSSGADIDIKYCSFKGGRMLLWASGGKHISVTNCAIESKATGSGEDCIAVHSAGRVFIDSIRLTGMGGTIAQGTKNDAIDLDDVDSCFIMNSIISHFSDDGVDIGTTSKYALISGNQISYCNYGTTVGENSLAYIENNIFSFNDAGIQVHNHAVVYANYNTLYHNTWGIECYHSEEGSAQTGGTAYIQNTIFSATVLTEILTQSSSSLTISYSISDGDALPGNHNISGDPKFTDPGQNDFTLQETSPCINAGSPGPGVLPTTMGAWGGAGSIITKLGNSEHSSEILVYPNPVSDFMNIVISHDQGDLQAELFNTGGRLLLTKTISKDNFSVNMSSFPAGTYILRISKGNTITFCYVIKP